jgi:hypothetical protein
VVVTSIAAGFGISAMGDHAADRRLDRLACAAFNHADRRGPLQCVPIVDREKLRVLGVRGNVGGITGDDSVHDVAVHHVVLHVSTTSSDVQDMKVSFLLTAVAIRQPTGR